MNTRSTSSTSTDNGNLARQLYQAWLALRDPSIPWAAKWLIPLAAMAYWISPVDLISFFPGDDIVVVLIALNLFLRTIARYQDGQTGGAAQGQHTADPQSNWTNDKTIETTWRVVEE